jgi:23S rRNA pseudouridine1911/1915/1917 synthase
MLRAMPQVIADTEALLVLDKPAGLITHGDGRTVEPSLSEWIRERYPAMASVGEPWVSPQGERVPVCGLVHRLDRTTSGVIIAAKTDDAFARLKRLFRERAVEKEYCAFVYGHVEKSEGTIVAEIVRTGGGSGAAQSVGSLRRWVAVATTPDDPRAAITDYRVLSRCTDDAGNAVSYLSCSPKTGRTHQIRVHLAHIGHPLIADHLYASAYPRLLGFERPALHAASIAFEWEGVRRGAVGSYCAPLPPDFDHALSATQGRSIARTDRGGIMTA